MEGAALYIQLVHHQEGNVTAVAAEAALSPVAAAVASHSDLSMR